MIKFLSIALSGLLAVMSVGCATIVSEKGTQSVLVRSGSVRAKYEVIDRETNTVVQQGLTPDTLQLWRSQGYFRRGRYVVNVTHPETGKVYSVEIKGKASNWYIFGNLAWLPLFIIGAPIGWFGLDPASGAMWKLRPNKVEVPF